MNTEYREAHKTLHTEYREVHITLNTEYRDKCINSCGTGLTVIYMQVTLNIGSSVHSHSHDKLYCIQNDIYKTSWDRGLKCKHS